MTFSQFRHTLAAWHAIAGSATYAAAAFRSRSPLYPAGSGGIAITRWHQAGSPGRGWLWHRATGWPASPRPGPGAGPGIRRLTREHRDDGRSRGPGRRRTRGAGPAGGVAAPGAPGPGRGGPGRPGGRAISSQDGRTRRPRDRARWAMATGRWGTRAADRNPRDRWRRHHRDQTTRTVDTAGQAGRPRCHRDRCHRDRARRTGGTRSHAGPAWN
jgi:hypothetical protein